MGNESFHVIVVQSTNSKKLYNLNQDLLSVRVAVQFAPAEQVVLLEKLTAEL